MDTQSISKQMGALASETRLEIFRLLCNAGNTGLTVGKIKDIMDIPASTLSHHIAKLVAAGLVDQMRRQRSLVCTANQEQMDELVMYMANECCGPDSSIWG
jgi:DNA-binding transcriptional ArsR family regulator